MLSKYLITFLRLFIGGIIFWNTIPRAEAQEFNANNEAPTCKNERVVENKDSKPPVKKVEEKSKSDLEGEAENSSAQDEESCPTPATDETENIEDSSNGSSNASDPYASDSNSSEEPTSLPNGSNTDSHDVNFSLQLNTGGGTSPDSGLSLPEGNISPTVEPDPSSPIPSQPLPDGETNPASRSLSPQPKKPQQTKHKKGEQNKPNKSHKDKKDSKRDRLNQRMNKPNKSPLEESKQVNKSERKTNPNTHRNPLKQLRNSETQNNSYQDQLPSMRRKPNAQKQRVKGHRSELHPIHQRKMRKTVKPNLNHPTDSSPKIYTPRVHRQLPHSLKNRPHLHPRIRQNMSPHKVFRPSVPKNNRTHRRAR
jgi:hypothetical protein